MAQNYQLGELGQVLTANVSSNLVTFSSTVNVGNSQINSISVSSDNFSFNTNGKILINGSPGTATQILTSNGSGGGVYWAPPAPLGRTIIWTMIFGG